MALIEHILLVESDPDISDLIARQALQPLGYQVDVVGDVAAALKKSLIFPGLGHCQFEPAWLEWQGFAGGAFLARQSHTVDHYC